MNWIVAGIIAYVITVLVAFYILTKELKNDRSEIVTKREIIECFLITWAVSLFWPITLIVCIVDSAAQHWREYVNNKEE